MSEKALKACAEYARLSAEIKRLTREVGNLLGQCPLQFRKEVHSPDGRLIAINTSVTHLAEAYEADVDESGRYFLTKEEKMEVLSVCPHCLAAHEAIQARKAARKSLGAVKRHITMLGRAENARLIK